MILFGGVIWVWANVGFGANMFFTDTITPNGYGLQFGLRKTGDHFDSFWTRLTGAKRREWSIMIYNNYQFDNPSNPSIPTHPFPRFSTSKSNTKHPTTEAIPARRLPGVPSMSLPAATLGALGSQRGMMGWEGWESPEKPRWEEPRIADFTGELLRR